MFRRGSKMFAPLGRIQSRFQRRLGPTKQLDSGYVLSSYGTRRAGSNDCLERNDLTHEVPNELRPAEIMKAGVTIAHPSVLRGSVAMNRIDAPGIVVKPGEGRSVWL